MLPLEKHCQHLQIASTIQRRDRWSLASRWRPFDACVICCSLIVHAIDHKHVQYISWQPLNTPLNNDKCTYISKNRIVSCTITQPPQARFSYYAGTNPAQHYHRFGMPPRVHDGDQVDLFVVHAVQKYTFSPPPVAADRVSK